MHYGQKTAAKAYSMAAQDALHLYVSNRDMLATIQAQRDEIARLKGIINQAQAAAALLMEKVGQGDMLSV